MEETREHEVHVPLRPGRTCTDQTTSLVLPGSQAFWNAVEPGGGRGRGLFKGPRDVPLVEMGLGSSVPGLRVLPMTL